MRYSLSDLSFGGKYHQQFWEKKFNPNADIENGLANCTTATIGFCLVENDPYPVSRITSANQWHEVLINDWTYIDYSPENIHIGDIIEWVDGCHVCKVADIQDGKIYINGSYYTGEHGVAVYNGSYDTRPFQTLQELSNFMVNNYPERMYHYWTLEKEISMVGHQPRYILVRPKTLSPVEEDSSVNQIECTDNTLRIRLEPSLNGEIVGHVSIGFYNVENVKSASSEDMEREPGLKCWYEIAKDRWCANVTTIYHEAMDDPIKELQKYFDGLKRTITQLSKENTDLKADMKIIREVAEKWNL